VARRRRLPHARQIAYGAHPDQVGNLHLPDGEGPWPTVVLVHGGFWKWGWDRTLMTRLAHDLAGRGYAAWNIEYRRVGQEGGGWPGTLEDAAAAVDRVADFDEVDVSRVVTVGHSAGGHLAVWLAGRHRLPAGAPGAGPHVRPLAAVSQAGVLDLVAGANDDLGSGACVRLLGGDPDAKPARYAVASPTALVPLGVPVLLVHGAKDDIVPPSQSHGYAATARGAGDLVDVVDIASADHFDVIEPDAPGWAAVVERLPGLLGGVPPE
jgi:acetyl esterase/lipase